MARVADFAGPGSGAGCVASPCLLGTPAQWRLPTGAAKLAPLRWGAHALIVAVVTIQLLWLAALIADARAGQGDWLTVIFASLLGAAWLAIVGHLWRGLRRPGAVLTLAWGGLPPHRPPSSHAMASAGAKALPGWSVREWNQPVSAHVVFDLGAWVLVKVGSKPGVLPSSIAWSWLDARLAFQGPSGHHWRALLFNRQANDVGAVQASRADVTAVVASWVGMQPFKNSGRAKPRPVASGDDFAPTQVLEPIRSGSRA